MGAVGNTPFVSFGPMLYAFIYRFCSLPHLTVITMCQTFILYYELPTLNP